MDLTRCPKCNKRLIAMMDPSGKTDLRCLQCDQVDPMKTEIVKWANSELVPPTKVA